MSTFANESENTIDATSILDALQDMNDDEWYGDASEDAGPVITDDEPADDSQEVLYTQLSHNATQHELCSQIGIEKAEVLIETKTDTEFDGIVMDHGAQNTVGGQPQYAAHCKHTRQPMGDLEPT